MEMPTGEQEGQLDIRQHRVHYIPPIVNRNGRIMTWREARKKDHEEKKKAWEEFIIQTVQNHNTTLPQPNSNQDLMAATPETADPEHRPPELIPNSNEGPEIVTEELNSSLNVQLESQGNTSSPDEIIVDETTPQEQMLLAASSVPDKSFEAVVEITPEDNEKKPGETNESARNFNSSELYRREKKYWNIMTILTWSVVAIFAGAMLVKILWFHDGKIEIKEGIDSTKLFCQSPECLVMASKILNGLNQTVNPCVDFFGFACGGWIASNPIPKTMRFWSVELKEQFQVKNKIRTLINTMDVGIESNNVELKVKKFYESCMTTELVENDGTKTLEDEIKKLGGWDALNSMHTDSWDFNKALRGIHANYHISPYFRIDLATDPLSPERNIIRIRPSGTTLSHTSYYDISHPMVKSFKSYAQDVIERLGASRTWATSKASEIFEHERQIAQITTDTIDLNSLETYTRVELGVLDVSSNAIFWKNLISGIFPRGNISVDTQLLVSSMKYLNDISKLISNTPKVSLNNYLIWYFTHKNAPYLSKYFSNARETFLQDFTGRKAPMPRWEFCLEESIRVFQPVMNAWLAQSCDHRTEKIKKVAEIFGEIRNSMLNQISKAELDSNTKTSILNRVRKMTVKVGAIVTEKKKLNDLYIPLLVDPNKFFKNILHAREYTHKLEQNDLNENINTIGKNFPTFCAMFPEEDFKITYARVENKIIFPETRLQSQELMMNHISIWRGSLGVEIAEAMVRSIESEFVLNGRIGYPMTEMGLLLNITPGMLGGTGNKAGGLSQLTGSEGGSETRKENSTLELTRHLTAVQVALNVVKNFESKTFLPSLPLYDHIQIFFISLAQTQCSSKTPQFKEMEKYFLGSLSDEERVKTVSKGNTYFKSRFSC